MKTLCIRFLETLCTLSLPLTALLHAAEPGQTTGRLGNSPSSGSGSSTFCFELLPSALNPSPRLDLTVFCELTEEGKKRPLVTRDAPATYLAYCNGFQKHDDSPEMIQPEPLLISKSLLGSLAKNGFNPVAKGQKPDLVLFYTWGTFAGNSYNNSPAALLTRASLIGGKTFVNDFKDSYFEEARQRGITWDDNGNQQYAGGSFDAYSVKEAPSVFGEQSQFSFSQGSFELLSPMNRLSRKDSLNEFLIDQACADIYYIVVSAYDHDAMAKGKRVLLWRAKITADARGHNMIDAIGPMVENASACFGRDMDKPSIAFPKVPKNGRVKIGDPEVVGVVNAR